MIVLLMYLRVLPRQAVPQRVLQKGLRWVVPQWVDLHSRRLLLHQSLQVVIP